MRFWRVAMVVTLVACGGKVALEDDFNSGPSQGSSSSSGGRKDPYGSSGTTGGSDPGYPGYPGYPGSSASSSAGGLRACENADVYCKGTNGFLECNVDGTPTAHCESDPTSSDLSVCSCGTYGLDAGNGFQVPLVNDTEKAIAVWQKYCGGACEPIVGSSSSTSSSGGNTICDDGSNAGCVGGAGSSMYCAVTPPNVKRWLACNGSLQGGTYRADCSCPIPGSGPDGGGGGNTFKIATTDYKSSKYLFSLWQKYCGGVCY